MLVHFYRNMYVVVNYLVHGYFEEHNKAVLYIAVTGSVSPWLGRGVVYIYMYYARNWLHVEWH